MSPILFDFGPLAGDFHDQAHAWVLGLLGAHSTASHMATQIAATADGGATWTARPLTVDGQAVHVQFIDALRGWVFATPSAGGAIGAGDTTLYRTVDGGTHWQVMKPASELRPALGGSATTGSLPEACSMGGPITAPSFINASVGWLGAFCDRVFLYATHDGGLTWTPQSLPLFPGPGYTDPTPPLYSVDSPIILSPTTAAVFVHRGFTTGANALQDAALYVTTDAGSTWLAHRLPAAELSATFLDAQHGWMVAAGPYGDTERLSLYSTSDGGATWARLFGPDQRLRNPLSFVSSSTGLLGVPTSAGQPAGLRKTLDGGRTWTDVMTSID